MIRIFKRILTEIMTFLKHGSVLRGGGIIIKNGKVSHKGVEIFGNVFIRDSQIGDHSKIYDFSIIANSSLAGNKIGKNCSIGNCTIGAYSYVADFSMVNNVTIGKFCSIGPGFKCGLGSHPLNYISSSPFFYSTLNATGTDIFTEYDDVKIGNDVWVGANVFIKDGITVGDGAIIATGAVVLDNVADYAIVGGIPAKLIRYRHDVHTIASLKKLAWWNKDVEWLKANREHFQKEISGLDDLKDITD